MDIHNGDDPRTATRDFHDKLRLIEGWWKPPAGVEHSSHHIIDDPAQLVAVVLSRAGVIITERFDISEMIDSPQAREGYAQIMADALARLERQVRKLEEEDCTGKRGPVVNTKRMGRG